MSAFVVGTDCISRVVYGLNLIGMPHKDTDTQFGRRLLEMNIEAVRQRYGDSEVKNERPAKYKYAEPPLLENCTPAVAASKALHCFLYQCSEGSVPEMELFQELEGYSKKLDAKILSRRHGYDSIYSMPEFNAAPWGD